MPGTPWLKNMYGGVQANMPFLFRQKVKRPLPRIVAAIVILLEHFPLAIVLHLILGEMRVAFDHVRALDVNFAVVEPRSAGVVARFVAV